MRSGGGSSRPHVAPLTHVKNVCACFFVRGASSCGVHNQFSVVIMPSLSVSATCGCDARGLFCHVIIEGALETEALKNRRQSRRHSSSNFVVQVATAERSKSLKMMR
jgi:hypothetical protein